MPEIECAVKSNLVRFVVTNALDIQAATGIVRDRALAKDDARTIGTHAEAAIARNGAAAEPILTKLTAVIRYEIYAFVIGADGISSMEDTYKPG